MIQRRPRQDYGWSADVSAKFARHVIEHYPITSEQLADVMEVSHGFLKALLAGERRLDRRLLGMIERELDVPVNAIYTKLVPPNSDPKFARGQAMVRQFMLEWDERARRGRERRRQNSNAESRRASA